MTVQISLSFFFNPLCLQASDQRLSIHLCHSNQFSYNIFISPTVFPRLCPVLSVLSFHVIGIFHICFFLLLFYFCFLSHTTSIDSPLPLQSVLSFVRILSFRILSFLVLAITHLKNFISLTEILLICFSYSPIHHIL